MDKNNNLLFRDLKEVSCCKEFPYWGFKFSCIGDLFQFSFINNSLLVVWLLQLESLTTEINDILKPLAKGITINR